MKTIFSFTPTGYNPVMTVSTDEGKTLDVPIFQVNVFSYRDNRRAVINAISYASDQLSGKSFEFDLGRPVRTIVGITPEADEQVFVEIIPHRDGFKEGILCIREDIANVKMGTPRKDIFHEDSPTKFVGRIIADCSIEALGSIPGQITLAISQDRTIELWDRLKKSGAAVSAAETLTELDSCVPFHRAVMAELEGWHKFWLEASIDDILWSCSHGGAEV